MHSARSVVASCAVIATAFGLPGDAPARAERSERAPAPHAAFDPRSVQLPSDSLELRMRSALAAGQPAQARRLGQSALVLGADAASTGRIRWLLVASDASDADTQLQLLFESGHPLGRWAGLRLAERLRARDPQRAAALARALATGWAGATRAQRVIDELAPRAAAPEPPSLRTELERAKGSIAAQRYEEARALLSALAVQAQREPQLSCAIGLELGRVLLFQKKRDKGATHMLALRERCADPELQTWARYYAGQAMLRDADPQGAIAVLSELVALAPSSTLADDALQMQAVAYADQGRAAEQIGALEQIVTRYPDGDMRPDASFELAMLARARGQGAFDQALAHLAALRDTAADERVEGQEGRAAYWHARTRQDRGEIAPALAEYEALVRSAWPSYYAQHALGRIEALDAARALELKRALAAPQPAQAHALSFEYRAELDDSAFQSALELLRVGEPARAIDELRFLRALGPDARDAELSWLGVALLHHAGAFSDATRLARPLARGLLRARDEHDEARARALLRIAYPTAYEPTLGSAAQEAGISPSFLRAIAREESTFDPAAVSPARAYGLVQLIATTARAYGKPLGLASDPAALKQPEINLRIGARFMKDLFVRYGAFAPLVPAAYNAGPGATDRWLGAAKSEALDAFIEGIPYRETRRYTRRVLQSYAMYKWLDEGSVEALPVALARPPS